MDIREATPGDKERWDHFVDAQNGSFKYYFDWKYVYESRNELPFQLLIEDDADRIISIFPVTKTRKIVYPSLYARAPLFRNDLAPEEKQRLTAMYLDYLDENYTRGSSFFRIEDFETGGDFRDIFSIESKLNPVLIKNGFHSRYNTETGLPCLHVLGLEQPFHEKIWKRLWSRNLKKVLRKAERRGITIVYDSQMKYLDEYIKLLILNFKRHGSHPPSEKEVEMEFGVFRDKSKLFVALVDKRPIAIVSCHYTPSTCYLSQIGSKSKNTGNAVALIYRTAIEDACNLGYKYCHLGYTDRTTLANYKDHFKGYKIPAIVYEKRYSLLGTFMELAPKLVMNMLFDRNYLWNNRRLIWEKIIH